MLVVIVATAGGQLLLNRWNKPFYDAIERRDLEGFQHQLMVFAAIAGGLLLLNIIQQWLNQRFRLRLREALTLDLASEWLKPGRAFRLANAGAIGVNPDQRMQQDAGHLSDLSTDLGVGFVQSFILLVSFRRRAVGFVVRIRVPLRRAGPSTFRATWCGPRSSMPAPRPV